MGYGWVNIGRGMVEKEWGETRKSKMGFGEVEWDEEE